MAILVCHERWRDHATHNVVRAAPSCYGVEMSTVTLEKAATDLPALIARARAGEEIVITSNDEVLVKLVAVPPVDGPRVPGDMKGMLNLPDSFFFDPLPDDELALWNGERDRPK